MALRVEMTNCDAGDLRRALLEEFPIAIKKGSLSLGRTHYNAKHRRESIIVVNDKWDANDINRRQIPNTRATSYRPAHG